MSVRPSVGWSVRNAFVGGRMGRDKTASGKYCVYELVFSCVHATLYVTMSVGPLVVLSVGPSMGNHFAFSRFFRSF